MLVDGAHGELGDHPCFFVCPIVLDLGAAQNFGCAPDEIYAETASLMLFWLSDAVRAAGAERHAPFDDWFAPDSFDYGVEDMYSDSGRGRADRS